MKKAGKILALLVVMVGALWSQPGGMRAQGGNQAALVIRYSDDRTETACVNFEEPQISGFDLLQRSGLSFEIEAQGLGAIVCSIDGSGCPASDCWCQCKGGAECIYWSYWHKLQEGWKYSQAGSTIYQINPGSVDGWSWGPGAANQAVAPPDLSFEEVCQIPATSTATPPPSPTVTNTSPPIIITPVDKATPIIDAVNTAVPVSPSVTGTKPAPSTVTATPPFFATDTPISSQQSTPVSTPKVDPEQEDIVQSLIIETASAQPQPETKGQAVNDEGKQDPSPTAVVATETSIPMIAAVSQEVETPDAPPSNMKGDQKIAMITAEPLDQLTVIGSGVVPTIEKKSSQNQSPNQEIGNLSLPEWFPYLIFLLIFGGLGALLLILSARRKNKGIS